MPDKARQTLVSAKIGVHKLVDTTTGAILTQSQTFCNFVNYQWVSSIGHPWKRSANWKKMNIAAHLIQDMGGPFETGKVNITPGGVDVVAERLTGGYLRSYRGPIHAYFEQKTGKRSDIQSPSTDAQMDGFGATAISKTAPTNPLSGGGQFLGELRQLPTTSQVATWKGKTQFFRDLKKGKYLRKGANDYLNFQFGWVPFARDVKNLLEVARDSEKHIAQLVRDSGRGVRRKFNFPWITSTVVTDLGNGYGAPSIDSYLVVSPGKLTRTVTTTVKRYFSGSFTYYLPKENVDKLRLSLAHKLYGLRLDPDLIWNLAPWTWFTDWLSNFGDVVNNVALFANDGLVLRYGYIMETTIIKTEYSLRGLELYGTGPLNLTQSFETITKKRRRATPFGFGLNQSAFTPRQWSIIAALGISKSPRSLIS